MYRIGVYLFVCLITYIFYLYDTQKAINVMPLALVCLLDCFMHETAA